MEEMMKALLDVVRAQHTAAKESDEKPFDMDDIVDLAFQIAGRPEEPEEQQEMTESVQKMAQTLAPDLFPPKTFEEMDDLERAASAVSMIEERLRQGVLRGQEAADVSKEEEEIKANDLPDFSEQMNGMAEQEEEQEDFNPQETADLNELIYNNFMQMMGLNDPKVEYPFERSQIKYGREKTATEMLEEEAAEKKALQEEEEKRRPVSAWELAQAAIDQDDRAHQKEEYEPKEMKMPETKSASQLAAEAIARAKEEDQMKLEAEKRAERLMEEARKRGKDPMEFALHQQEILNYMEKNSDELVSFEDYEDLSPEEKLEIEKQMYREKQLEAGVAPEDIPEELPPEILDQAGLSVPDASQAAVSGEDSDSAAAEDHPGSRNAQMPMFTEAMLRQIGQEVVRENEEMIRKEDPDADLGAINEAIFTNLQKLMESGDGTIHQEDLESLIGEVISRNTEPEAVKEGEVVSGNTEPEPAKEPEETPRSEETKVIPTTPQEPMSAVDLAKAAQEASRPEKREEAEGKSAVDLAREAQENAKRIKEAQAEPEMEELTEDDMNFDELDLFDETQPEETDTSADMPEAADRVKETGMPADIPLEADKSEEAGMPEEASMRKEADVPEEAVSEETGHTKDVEEEIEYVDPGELVLGEHTQAEIDEAIENLASLGLEGDVYERAKRMLLLELAGSEAELDAWLAEQENGKIKKGIKSALDQEESLESLDDLELIDEDDLEKELELAMDEDFVVEEASDVEQSVPEADAGQHITGSDAEQSAPDTDAGQHMTGSDVEQSAPDADAGQHMPGSDAEQSAPEADAGQHMSGSDAEQSAPDVEVEQSVPDSHMEQKAEHLVEEEIEPPKEEKHSRAGYSRKRKNIVKRKEKTVPEKKEETILLPDSGPVETKEFQVSVRHPFVLKNSASYVDQFKEYIVDTQENRKLSTGFKRLDAMLRYGLHKGSYFVDSVPQYLKNGFMQQIADRAAESGVDVLYISTELSRYDLMVETISRLSYEMSKKDEEKAVSAMAIMTGEEGADVNSLKDELNWYRGRISEHLFVLDQDAVSEYVESLEEEISAGAILEELIRSIVREGAHKPVIFIDNIENILSADDSEDMKPLMEGIRKMAKELGVPIVMSYGYAQAEGEEDLEPSELAFHESLGNMCDVYLELKYADMITEDYEELMPEDIQEMAEEGETLLLNVLLHKNRRKMKASCQIQATPKFHYFEE